MHFKVNQHFLKSIPDELLKFLSSAAAFYCTDCCLCCISDVGIMGIHIRFFVPVLCAHFRHWKVNFIFFSMYLFDLKKKILKRIPVNCEHFWGGESACWLKINRDPLQDDCTEPLLMNWQLSTLCYINKLRKKVWARVFFGGRKWFWKPLKQKMWMFTLRGVGRGFPTRIAALTIRPEQKEGGGSKMGWGVRGADFSTPAPLRCCLFFFFSSLSVCIIVF